MSFTTVLHQHASTDGDLAILQRKRTPGWLPSSVVVLQYYWVKKEAENIAASSNIVAKYANVMHIVKQSTFFVCLFFGIIEL